MNINKLKFNATKTEIIVMCASHVKAKLSMPHVELGDTVEPVSTVANNIGVFFDDALSMNNQVQHICRIAYLRGRPPTGGSSMQTAYACRKGIFECCSTALEQSAACHACHRLPQFFKEATNNTAVQNSS